MVKVQNYSGVDVSKQSFHVSVEESGKVRTKKFPYTAEGMAECLGFLPKGTHCIVESTGTYHCQLAYYLFENGVCLSVVNPLSVKRYAQALMLRTKTDKADSRMLMAYGKSFKPKPWQPRESYCVELQQLINLRELLNKQEAAANNQLESIRHSVVQSSFAKEKLAQRLRQIKTDVKEVEQQLERLVLAHEKEAFENLQSIPGIGKKTAVVLIALTQGMEGFSSSKQVSSYFGLCPRIYDSGTTVKGCAKICKMGMALVRKLLYMCSLSAKKSNKACRELYNRLLARGKKKKLSLIAVANKLLKQAFAIIKHKTAFDENFLSNKLAY